MTENGLEQRMTPRCSRNIPLGQLEGGTNMVVVEGDEVGQIVLRGRCGRRPHSKRRDVDVLDLARGIRIQPLGNLRKHLEPQQRRR